MYRSGVKVSEFIRSIREEVDISISVPESAYVRSLNAVEQFLYTELLKEYVSVSLDYMEIENNSIQLSSLSVPDSCAKPEYDDIIRIYADEDELERSGISGRLDFPEKNLYYTDYDGNICILSSVMPDEILIVFRLRPAPKEVDSEEEVAVPPEFLDMVAARIRGDVYKIANEDGLSAKWLSEYNNSLETFSIWAAKRNERFGG